jgi:hypothetical protein
MHLNISAFAALTVIENTKVTGKKVYTVFNSQLHSLITPKHAYLKTHKVPVEINVMD